jgi:hypothetical protein
MRITVSTKNVKQWDTMISILLAMGYVWHRSSHGLTNLDDIRREWYRDYPHINIKIDNKSISGSSRNACKYSVDNLNEVMEEVLGLNSNIIENVCGFTTTVKADEIKVGCQTIPADKFREIMEAVKQVKNS